MRSWLHGGLTLARRIYRRLNERAGLVSGFSDLEMHQWMLADEVRLAAYEAAISRAVRPGDVVLDVGAGTGILSMMACRAGASKVYAIEESRILDLTRRIVADNGYADRIELIHGNSRKVTLPRRADLVVSETIGAFVFSEDTLATLRDARERFLKPGGRIIPRRIRIYLTPIESFEEGVGFWEKPIRGFDMRAAAPHVNVEAPDAARRIETRHFLDEGALAYDLDFTCQAPLTDFSRTLRFVARRDGVLHGFAGSWEADLHEGISLRCAPGAPPLHWPPLLFRLPAGRAVREGQRVTLSFGRKDRPGWHWSWSAHLDHS